MNYKLIVFDVDGTLVTTKSGETFRVSADDWQWLPGRVEKCEQLTDEGVILTLASNQGGVAFPWSKFSEMDIRMELQIMGIEINTSFIGVCCTTPNEKALPEYHNTNDIRRKPGPGMLLEAMRHVGIEPQDTLMVGDRPEDEGAAQAAGCSFMWAADFFVEAPN